MSIVKKFRLRIGRRTAVMAAVVGAAAASVAVPALAAPPSGADGKVAPSLIRGAGSDTTYDLMQNLDKAYNLSPGCAMRVPPSYPAFQCDPIDQPNVVRTENYDHEVATSYFPQGSSAGLRMLCQKNDSPNPMSPYTIDYARSSSSPSSLPSQCQTNGSDPLRYVAFAKDAISVPKWSGGASGPVTNLTHAQLQEIFRDVSGDGCTEDWGDFGGTPGTPIMVHGVQNSSGTYATWSSFLGGDPNACVAATGGQILFENNCTPINNLSAADKGRSIWWLSYGKYASGNAECDPAATDLISVGGIAPSETTIQNGTYQYNRSLYNVYRRSSAAGGATGATLAYVGEFGWICKGNANHSKPVGGTGQGQEHAGADRNWGEYVDSIISEAGFVKVNPTGNKCTAVNVN